LVNLIAIQNYSSVAIVTALWAGKESCFNFQQRQEILFPKISRHSLWHTQPHIQWTLWKSLPGIERASSEANRLLPSSAQVKNNCTFTSATPHAFMSEQVKLYSVIRQDSLIRKITESIPGRARIFLLAAKSGLSLRSLSEAEVLRTED